jgi:hypothetical protein
MAASNEVPLLSVAGANPTSVVPKSPLKEQIDLP